MHALHRTLSGESRRAGVSYDAPSIRVSYVASREDMRFGQWEYECDVEATKAAYARTPSGGADECRCTGCENYRRVRDDVFDPRARELLAALGIDYRKESEAYHLTRVRDRVHRYGGWFHFVGTLTATGDFPHVPMTPSLSMSMTTAHAPALSELKGKPLVQVEFDALVPWVIDAMEP